MRGHNVCFYGAIRKLIPKLQPSLQQQIQFNIKIFGNTKAVVVKRVQSSNVYVFLLIYFVKMINVV